MIPTVEVLQRNTSSGGATPIFFCFFQIFLFLVGKIGYGILLQKNIGSV